MKDPPAPLHPSGLAEDCPDVVNSTLVVRGEYGWGWTHDGEAVDDYVLCNGEFEVIVEEYVSFTRSRSGILGRVTKSPAHYQFDRFVAFTMGDSCDFNFTNNICQAWRFMVGDGVLDTNSSWFPILKGKSVYFGYGVIGKNRSWFDQLDSQ
ncbi:hypothetical protein V2O64_24600 (plasmid) [Verrucomicrobiaceae bacterium 227]